MTSIKIVISRARVAFLALLTLFLVFSTTAIYAGWTSGEIQQRIIQPIQKSIERFGEQLADEIDKKPSPSFVASPSGDLFAEFEKTKPEPSKTSQAGSSTKQPNAPRILPSQPPAFSSVDYDAARKQQEQWWQQVQQNQQKFAEESKKRMEEFDRQAQQNMTDFQKQSGQKVQNFLNSQPQMVCTTNEQGVKICKLQ